MTEPPANELEKLRQALAGLEAQRGILGDVVEPALELVRRQIAALEDHTPQSTEKAGRTESDPSPDQRRIVAILFTDIVGSTALAERLDPEDWRRVVAKIHSMAGDQVLKNHGAVVQYLGDGLLALFGAQAASEQDAENAVRAALDIQTGLASLQNGLAGPLMDPPVQMRVGVHTGLVVVGDLGSEARREFTASGDAMNLAARLQSAAPPGGVLISHDVYRQARGSFETIPQPPLSVKGKSEPVQTYLVQRARERLFHTTARGVWGIETRTVGREAEHAQLQAAYLAVYQQGGVVWAQLSGEAGMGKSRLLEDMREWLDLRPERLRVLRGRAFSGDAGQPFSLVRRMWFDRFQITEDEPLASAEQKWVRSFQELGQTDQVEPAQALGLLVGLPFNASPYLDGMRGDPVQVKGRATVVSRELLHRIRLHQPVVFLLEDLHWADDPSLEYLIKVLFDGSPATNDGLQGEFVLAAARPEWEPPETLTRFQHTDPPGYLQIPLAPLPPAASRRLALELLSRVDGATPDIVDLIVERSEGVPYYAEELVNLLIDRGIIVQRGERWAFVSGHLDPAQLPLTLHHLLLTRLLSLAPEDRSCLQHSAVFGRNFWEGGVEALGIPAPHPRLVSLQPRSFVAQQTGSSFGSNIEWSFHHALLRDVAYESLLKRDRPSLHKSAAAWLEAQARQADRLTEFAGVLGDHAERAGEHSAAAEWYLLAGERAKNLGATREARSYFDRCLARLPAEDLERRWRALLGRSDALGMLADLAPRQANLAALLELAGQLDDARLAEALYRQGNLLESQGDYPAAFESYDNSLEAARRAGDSRLEALVLAIKGVGQNRMGESQAARVSAEAALALTSRLDELSAVRVTNNVAVFYIESGDLSAAARLHRGAADAAKHLVDRSAQTNSLTNLGYDYAMLGLYTQARAALEQALVIARAIDMRRESSYILLNLGLVRCRCGEAALSRQTVEQAIADLEAIGDVFGCAAGLGYLGLVFEQDAGWEAAHNQYRQARQRFAGVGVEGYAVDALAGIARCALAQGDSQAALQSADQVWTFLQDKGCQSLEFPIWAYLTCAQIYQALGEREKWQAAVQQGNQELHLRAAKISDAAWRQSFLENVAEHHAIQNYVEDGV
jgi:class 3 adenylate cyclase/tetratricopeptide (TPR) repeat protein